MDQGPKVLSRGNSSELQSKKRTSSAVFGQLGEIEIDLSIIGRKFEFLKQEKPKIKISTSSISIRGSKSSATISDKSLSTKTNSKTENNSGKKILKKKSKAIAEKQSSKGESKDSPETIHEEKEISKSVTKEKVKKTKLKKGSTSTLSTNNVSGTIPESKVLPANGDPSSSVLVEDTQTQDEVKEFESMDIEEVKSVAAEDISDKPQAGTKGTKPRKVNVKAKVSKVGKEIGILDASYQRDSEPLEVSHGSQYAEKIVPPALRDSGVMEMPQYLTKVQAYFDQLGYHRNGEPKTKVNIRLSIKHLMSTAKVLVKVGEPIKCLHALIMGVHFTNHIPIVERFPIHFKSEVKGKEYKHVVLGVYVQGHFGALGISRDPGLQDKPAVYPRLSELVNDYFFCYHASGHTLKELKIGSIITHDPHSIEHITWKLGKINFEMPTEQTEVEIEKCSRKLRSQMGLACLRAVRMGHLAFGPELVSGFGNQPRPGLTQVVRSKPRMKPKNQFYPRSRSLAVDLSAYNIYNDAEKTLVKETDNGLGNRNPARSRPVAVHKISKSKKNSS